MLNTHFINSEDNVNPFSDMEPIGAHRPITMLMIPTTNKVAPPSNFLSYDHYLTNGFLKSCFICKKDLGEMVDIFMYKDQSFCSDGCRNKQMDNDREKEINNRDKVINGRRIRKTSLPKGNKKDIFFIGDV
ncbi:unnamed protein product [Lactuca saligna]|uniref:FLZ-type domain-containing protein n=1 Tax=Lactuca saligna TaxID=75948 RepID=A0AA35Z611_LACSI|nr:unnamed protein product [Lactuca saligna]